MADTYTIKAINGTEVTVVFSIDNKTQKLSGLPTEDADALSAYLSQYAIDYKAGLDLQAIVPVVDPLALQLINKPQTVVDPTPDVVVDPAV